MLPESPGLPGCRREKEVFRFQMKFCGWQLSCRFGVFCWATVHEVAGPFVTIFNHLVKYLLCIRYPVWMTKFGFSASLLLVWNWHGLCNGYERRKQHGNRWGFR